MVAALQFVEHVDVDVQALDLRDVVLSHVKGSGAADPLPKVRYLMPTSNGEKMQAGELPLR